MTHEEGPVAATARAPRGREADILEAFTAMVAEHGYDVTSLSEIAGALNVSKGTIMYHFRSKDRLLQRMFLGYMRRRTDELALITQSSDSTVERLVALITSLMVTFREDRAATIAFSREFMRFSDQPVMSEVRAMRRAYVRTLSEMIQQGIDAGEIRDMSPGITALQIIGMCSWGWTWLRPDGPLSPEQLGAAFSRNLIAGIATSGSARIAESGQPAIGAAPAN